MHHLKLFSLVCFCCCVNLNILIILKKLIKETKHNGLVNIKPAWIRIITVHSLFYNIFFLPQVHAVLNTSTCHSVTSRYFCFYYYHACADPENLSTGKVPRLNGSGPWPVGTSVWLDLTQIDKSFHCNSITNRRLL